MGELPQADIFRCNYCMSLFESDDELELLKDSMTGEFYKGCPNCRTDQYLMDEPNLTSEDL